MHVGGKWLLGGRFNKKSKVKVKCGVVDLGVERWQVQDGWQKVVKLDLRLKLKKEKQHRKG